MKVIHSVRDARGNVIQKQPEAGTGQMRCMKCQMMCTAQRMPDGRAVMKCSGCGANYNITSLDAPRDPQPGVVPRRW